jgi:hypothetical protein
MTQFSTDVDQKFYSLVLEYFDRAVNEKPNEKTNRNEIYSEFSTLIEEGQVSINAVVTTISEMFSKFSTHKLGVLLIMRTMFVNSTFKGGYKYPEFFWLIVKHGVLDEMTEVDTVLPAVVEICGHDLIRSYLHYRLLEKPQQNIRSVIRAFYYTSYTVQTLEIIISTIPFDETHLELYTFVFSDAFSIIHPHRQLSLTKEDKEFLRGFFTQGLKINNVSIIKSCKRGLTRLSTIAKIMLNANE